MKITLIVMLGLLARPVEAYSTNYWIVYDAQGNYALGFSTGGMKTLTSRVTVSRGSSWAALKKDEGVR